VILQRGQKDDSEDRQPEVFGRLVDMAGDPKRSIDPVWLVGEVADRGDLGGRARYNLACFYAELAARHPGSPDAKALETARDQLKRAIATIAPSSRADLIAWALRDPSLAPALDGWDEAFLILGADPAAHPKPPHRSDLETINAIGGYAPRLAKLRIRTPAELRAALSTPAGQQRIAPLELGSETVARWQGLLDLRDLDGVGPTDVNLLEAAGVTDLDALAGDEPVPLHARLAVENRARRLVTRTPSLDDVAFWIVQARRP
jgi:predicted flap endonuclease-1-like 5' DNA nuclease